LTGREVQDSTSMTT